MPVNNPVTAPTHLAEWSTGGGSDKTLPTAPTLGHVVGEKADFNSSTNYILNNIAAWSKFNYELNAADIAYNNIEYENAENFGASALTASHMTFDALADKWYHSTSRASATELYDSATGADTTWSVAKTSLPWTADHLITPLRSNGTFVGIAIDDGFHLSTDLTVASLPDVQTAAFTSIDLVRDLIYDASEALWFAAGGNTAGTVGYIESSPDGTTWTVELTAADVILSLSSDNAGNGIASSETSTANYFTADMTGVWSLATTDPASALIQTVWAPSLELFIGVSAADSILFSEDGDNWHDTDLNCLAVYVTPEFVLMQEVTTADAIAFVAPASSRTAYTFARLGTWSPVASNNWNDDTTVECGQGKLIFTHDSTDILAYSHYGPEA